MMADRFRLRSSLSGQSQRFSDERATMAGEKELIFDIYGESSLLISPQDDVVTTVDGHGTDPGGARTTNGPAVMGNGRTKNGFLPSGMTRRSSRSDDNGMKQQLSKKIAPVLRRFTAKQSHEIVNDHRATTQTTVNGINTTHNATDRAGLNSVGETEADVRHSMAVETQSGSGHGLHHLQPILGAPAGFRDSSFDDSDEAPKAASSGNLRSSRVSMNAEGSSYLASQDFSSSFTDVKKRNAPPAPPPRRTLQPPPRVVQDFNSRKRHAPEAPTSIPPRQSTEATLPDVLQSSTTDHQIKVGGQQPADVGKVVIPELFRLSKSESSDFRSSSRSENSIFRRSSFLRHLETVVGRNTPSSSAVSTMTRGAERSDDAGVHTNNLSASGELDRSTESLVSRLFHSALSNHDDNTGSKKFKFPVAGIDVPAESVEQAGVEDDETVNRSRIRKGFSYLKDLEVAAEVTRRAASVTARRPHQSVEEAKTMRDRLEDAESDRDEATLRAARARLQAPQPRLDLLTATQSPTDRGGGREQMLLDIVDAARRRARKTATDADNDDYDQERATDYQDYPDEPARDLLRDRYDVDEKHRQQSTHEFISSSIYQSAFQSGTPGDAKDSTYVTLLDNRPEVPGSAAQTSAVLDNNQRATGHGIKASHSYGEPAASNFDSGSADGRGVGVTSLRAARHAHRSDIDRQLNAGEGLAVDDAANTASKRNGSYLPRYMSAAPVANRYADAGFETRHGRPGEDLQPQYDSRRLSVSSGSSDDELDLWPVDDEEAGDGYRVSIAGGQVRARRWDDDDQSSDGYKVSIAGGQVRARRWDDRLPRQRSAARNPRRRSSLRRRPHVRQRPVSVEIWSSGDEGGDPGWKSDRPRRRHFVADRRRSPLTVDTNDYAARPHSVIGHIRNPSIKTELGHRRMTGAVPNHVPAEAFQYFSDPEPKLGPYRTGAYVSQSDVYWNSHSSLNFVNPEVDNIRSGTQAFSTLPIQAIPFPVLQSRMEPVAAVDPQLADIGTKNRRYFVEMRLNAARGAREVAGAGGGGSSNGGESSGAGLTTGSWYGSAPQLLQLSDDVTDQYAGAPYNAPGTTTFSTMQPNVRHASVYDVTADRGGSLLVRRPESTPPWTAGGGGNSGHVRRAVTSLSRSPAAVGIAAAAERRRPPTAVNGDVNRSTVEFDIELEPMRRAEMAEEGRRSTLLSTVHANGLTGHRSASPPRYSIKLNDTMQFDIDGTGDWRRRQRPVRSPPNYHHVYQQRQQRRHRPPERLDDSTAERQRTVVDVQAPQRPSRRRRQVPIVYDDPQPSRIDSDVFFDDKVSDRMNYGAETGQAAGDLPRVVRGSILIRNAIDTAGTPRHIDVVTVDNDPTTGTEFVVEDNTNMFHGLYRQSRENPIYLSDPEMSPDEADGAAVNSVTYMSARSQHNAAKNRASIVDDFDRNVKISRGT